MVILTSRTGSPEKISPKMKQHNNKSKSWMVKKENNCMGKNFVQACAQKKNEKKSSRQVGFYRIPATKIFFFPPVISRGPSLSEVGNSEQ